MDNKKSLNLPTIGQLYGFGFCYADQRKDGIRYKTFRTPKPKTDDEYEHLDSMMHKRFRTRDGRIMEIVDYNFLPSTGPRSMKSFVVHAKFVKEKRFMYKVCDK